MVTHSIVYEYEEQLKDFIEHYEIKDSHKLLLQIFTSTVEESYIQRLLNIIKKYLPSISIIGTTTAGEILHSSSISDSTVLTFSIFDKTIVKTKFLESNGDSFELGYDLLNSFDKEILKESKLAISFANGISTNGDEFLRAFNVIKDDLVVAGGLAGDNYLFKGTFVFNEEKIVHNGAVMAILSNKKLKVFTNFNFNWQSLGKKHIIEKSHKNRVFTIDGKTMQEFYSYYLGDKILELLPMIGSEFPLILTIDGLEVARVVTSKLDDGSMVFAGNIKEGTEVRLGYGNVQLILEQASNNINILDGKCVESLFMYSCGARKSLLKDNIDIEIKPFSKVAKINGCFLYGEFYTHNKKAHFLNESMTILAISEGDYKINIERDEKELSIKNDNFLDFYRVQGLSKLITQTTNELEELNTTLENRVKKEVKESLAKDTMMEENARNAQMGEMIDMIVHQWRQPLNVFSTGITNLKFQQENGFLTGEFINKTSDVLLQNVTFLNNTIEDFRNYFKSSDKKEPVTPEKLVSKTSIMYKSLLNKHYIKLNENYSYNDFVEVPIGKMMQVILNIVKNAIDALVEKNIKDCEINISTFKENSYCILEIEDNAGGIPDDIIQKVFIKKFSTKKDTHGTGLGLYMSKNIMKMHLDGDLEVRNSAKGAVFIIRIPI